MSNNNNNNNNSSREDWWLDDLKRSHYSYYDTSPSPLAAFHGNKESNEQWLDQLTSKIHDAFPTGTLIIRTSFDTYHSTSVYLDFLKQLYLDLSRQSNLEAKEFKETDCHITVEMEIRNVCRTISEQHQHVFYLWNETHYWFQSIERTYNPYNSANQRVYNFFKSFMLAIHGFKAFSSSRMVNVWHHICQMKPNGICLCLHTCSTSVSTPIEQYEYVQDIDDLAEPKTDLPTDLLNRLKQSTGVPRQEYQRYLDVWSLLLPFVELIGPDRVCDRFFPMYR